MSTPEDVATALENAADYIEVHGWCRGELKMPDGQVCLAGAVTEVVGDGPYALYDACLQTVLRRLGLLQPRPWQAVFEWNDKPVRTKFEVIDVLRLTAKDLRNGEIEVAS